MRSIAFLVCVGCFFVLFQRSCHCSFPVDSVSNPQPSVSESQPFVPDSTQDGPVSPHHDRGVTVEERPRSRGCNGWLENLKRPVESNAYLKYQVIMNHRASKRNTEILVRCCDRLGMMICPDPLSHKVGLRTSWVFDDLNYCRGTFPVGITADVYLDEASWHGSEEDVPLRKRPNHSNAYLNYDFIRTHSAEAKQGFVGVHCCSRQGLVFCPDPLDHALMQAEPPCEDRRSEVWVHITQSVYTNPDAWHRERFDIRREGLEFTGVSCVDPGCCVIN